LGTARLVARTASRAVLDRLREGPLAGRVLATFAHVCDLLVPEDEVVALVTPRVGNGPLNVVVEGSAGLFGGVASGMPATLRRDVIKIGRLEVTLGEVTVWEPRPDWESSRRELAAIRARLATLRAVCLQQMPPGSLLALLELAPDRDRPPQPVLDAARRAATNLQGGWEGETARLQAGGARLAGLGGGLTPCGDDFLAGVMLWAWLAHPAPNEFCHCLAEEAAGRTTTLSAAFLRAAARGECGAAWHALLEALSGGDDARVAGVAREILAHGATSGADALAGFLWTGQNPRLARSS
jgi:hypothetical protein